MMCREIASPSPVPVRRVVKYGSKTRGRSSGSNADAAILDLDGDPVRRRARSVFRRIGSGGGALRPGQHRRAGRWSGC